MKHSFFRHAAAFVLSVLLAVAFLLLGACMPQSQIDGNISGSAAAMLEEGSYPYMADRSHASLLDRTTDALILGESKAMTIRQWETIFTNPQFIYDNEEGSAVYDFWLYSQDPDPQPAKYYVHYWMGFRPVMRMLLTFLDYHQILRYTAVAFFVLLAAVICSIAGNINTKTAFLFALSIIFIRPHVVSVSLQFSACFLIVLPAMLLIPRLHRNKQWETVFFLELGILTQYFDFYTTPIITFALPMTYLYLLRQQDHAPNRLKDMGFNALSWCAGYGLMWLAKLALTTAFTDVNAFAQGFDSFGERVGIEKVSGLESLYSPVAALRSVAVSLYSDADGKLILFSAILLTAVLLLYRFLRNKHTLRDLLPHWQLLLIAAMPILWFIVAAQPTANHYWFQYRGICASFWAGFAYLQLLFQKKHA